MQRFKAFAGFSLMVSLAACGGVDGDLRPEQQQKLDALTEARLVWASYQIEEYRLVIDSSCFCPPDDQQAIVAVDDGALSAYRANGQAAPSHPFGYSISGLFDDIEEAIVRDDADVTPTYHPDYGYPMAVQFDWLVGAVDDEVGLQVEFTSHHTLRQNLANARETWASQFEGQMYNMRIRIDAPNFPYDEALYVTVGENGNVLAANTVETQQSIDVASLLDYSVTVQDWFNEIDQAIQNPLSQVEASFSLAGYADTLHIQPSIFDSGTVISVEVIDFH